MKRLPDSELELMLVIWHLNKPVTRMEIEEKLDRERKLSPTSILSFLSRLEEKGFLKVEKKGKINIYTPLVMEDDYLKKESKTILKKMYKNSIKNFVTSLYDGDSLSDSDIGELQELINDLSSKKKADRL